jgi:Bacterial SH3 domain
MKPRGLLLPTFILIAALACNLPFANHAEEILPSATPPALPTLTIPFAPTQPLTTSQQPTPIPSLTPQLQVTSLPTAVPPLELHNPYAVVLVAENDVLNVRQSPGADSAIVIALPPDETGLELTGKQATIGDDRWVELHLPGGGSGWVNSYYLTEQVQGTIFCADPQTTQLVANLRQALVDRDGVLLGSLASPVHGLDLAYLHNGNTANYNLEEAGWLFQSDYAMDWGAHPDSGLEVVGPFKETVLPDLLDLLTAQYQTSCNTGELGGGNYIYKWPGRYHNINYLVLHKPGPPGNELSWRTWIAGVEYVQGHPYLFALVHLFWEP